MSGIFFTHAKPMSPAARELRKELEDYEKKGAELTLEGTHYSPRVIASRVAEQGCYMRDYSFSGKGMVKALNFRAIDHPDRPRQKH